MNNAGGRTSESGEADLTARLTLEGCWKNVGKLKAGSQRTLLQGWGKRMPLIVLLCADVVMRGRHKRGMSATYSLTTSGLECLQMDVQHSGIRSVGHAIGCFRLHYFFYLGSDRR